MSQQKIGTGKNDDNKATPSVKSQLRELKDKKNALEAEIARLENFMGPDRQLLPTDTFRREILGIISRNRLELSAVTREISAISEKIHELIAEISRVLVAHQELGGFSARKENFLVSEQLFTPAEAEKVLRSIKSDLKPIESSMKSCGIFMSEQESSRGVADRNYTIVVESLGLSRDDILSEIQRQQTIIPQRATSSSSSNSSFTSSSSSIPTTSTRGFFQPPTTLNTDSKSLPIPEDLQQILLKKVANELYLHSDDWGNFMGPQYGSFCLISDKTCSEKEADEIVDSIIKVFGNDIMGGPHPIIKDISSDKDQDPGGWHIHLETRIDASTIANEVLKIMVEFDRSSGRPTTSSVG